MKYTKLVTLIVVFTILGVTSAMAFDQNFREMVKKRVGLTSSRQHAIVNDPASALPENLVTQNESVSPLPKEEVSVSNTKKEETCFPKTSEFAGGGNMSFLEHSVEIINVPVILDANISSGLKDVLALHLKVHVRTNCEVLKDITIRHLGTGLAGDIENMYIINAHGEQVTERQSFDSHGLAVLKFVEPYTIAYTQDNDLYVFMNLKKTVPHDGTHQLALYPAGDGVSDFNLIAPSHVVPGTANVFSGLFTIVSGIDYFYKIQLFGGENVQKGYPSLLRESIARVLGLLKGTENRGSYTEGLIPSIFFDSQKINFKDPFNSEYFITVHSALGPLSTQKVYGTENLAAQLSKGDDALLPYILDPAYCKIDADCILSGTSMCDYGGGNKYKPFYDFAECHHSSYHQEDEKELQKMCTEKQYPEVSYNGVKCVSNKCVAQNRKVTCRNWE